MKKNLDELEFFELIQLRNSYTEKIADIDKVLVAKNIHQLQNNIGIPNSNNTEHNKERLTRYLEKTNINNLYFLRKSLSMPSENRLRCLTSEKLILLNSKARKIAASYGITNSVQLCRVFNAYYRDNQYHPILQNEFFMELSQKVEKLSYLDEIFQDQSNCLDYQGVYTVFMYIKKYLSNALTSNSFEEDDQIVFKHYKDKVRIVSENIGIIANELLALKNSIPGSRLAVFNRILTPTANKKQGTYLTLWQRNLIDAIAYGTTLDKLESKNYEDAKQLIYLPYKNDPSKKVPDFK